MKVNPELFFKFHDGKFIVWNYRSHEQFELTLPYLQRLYADDQMLLYEITAYPNASR